MQKLDKQPFSAATAPVLKLVGLLLVLVSVFDYLFLFIFSGLPPQASTLDGLVWRVAVVEQIVDRGAVSLVGLVILLIGFWMDSFVEIRSAKRKLWRALGFLAFILASLMGLGFLLLSLLHLNNTNDFKTEKFKQISQEVAQAEAQVGTKLNQEVQQKRSQILGMLQNEQQLKQAIDKGQIPPEQANLLQQFKTNPQALDQFLAAQSKQFETQAKDEIQKRKQTAELQTQSEAQRTGFRTTIRSLLLAIGYTAIGWVGLRELASSGRRSHLDSPSPSDNS